MNLKGQTLTKEGVRKAKQVADTIGDAAMETVDGAREAAKEANQKIRNKIDGPADTVDYRNIDYLRRIVSSQQETNIREWGKRERGVKFEMERTYLLKSWPLRLLYSQGALDVCLKLLHLDDFLAALVVDQQDLISSGIVISLNFTSFCCFICNLELASNGGCGDCSDDFSQMGALCLLLCSSWGLKTITQSCDPNDMLALKEFAGKLTNGSIITSWSSKTDCCQWEGLYAESYHADSVQKGSSRVNSALLGRLDQLKSVNLSCNQLSGGLPLELSSLKQLEVLDLSHNLLSGQVSGVLSGLLSIRTLNISSNLFKEDLLELGGYPNLVVFNMSNNSFTGRITSQICSSSKGIQILDLSANHLVGDLKA
ncbi:phytosulfokine receptor [Salix suchowensis]|nr:phytosulfokine receptor [Salix suchowensis]